MNKIDLKTFSSPDVLAQAAAELWAASDAQTVAISGGRITTAFLKKAVPLFKNPPAFHLFWADERCVPPESPESNFAQALEHFIRPLKFPEGQIHRIRGELSPGEAAVQASREFKKLGLPVLDLVFLGMGEDGHVASLFPDAGHEVELATEPYIAVTGPKPPPNRVSLTYQMLTSAKKVCCLVSGAGKESALKRCLEFDHLPLGTVLKHRTNTTIMTDLKL